MVAQLNCEAQLRPTGRGLMTRLPHACFWHAKSQNLLTIQDMQITFDI
jgi:hypothetical protein